MPTNDPPPISITRTFADTNQWVDTNGITYSNSSNIVWNGDPGDNAARAKPRLTSLPLDLYSEWELRDLFDTLAEYIDQKYPPKPPKFKSVEEADAWMEKHYG